MMFYYAGDFHKDFNILKTRANSNGGLDCSRIENFTIDSADKSIVILCGNDSKSQRRAEFYAYLCRSWVKEAKDVPDFSTYSIYYPNIQPLFNENPNIKLDYKGLAVQMFQNVLYKDGKIQAVEQIKKNLANVVFFGHSAGGLVMDELMRGLTEMLVDAKMTKADMKQVFNSIVFVAYAPYSLVTAPIKAVYVAPIYDSIGSVKLVYRKIITGKDIISSNPNIDIWGEKKLNARRYLNFIQQYTEAIRNGDTLYFANENSLVATPNLLYADGKREDHNFAGAISYTVKNPYQTKAGKMTAKFMGKTLEYCLTTKREDFSIKELYERTLNTDLDNERNL